MTRDPRKYPASGDVLKRFGCTRKVNPRGTLTAVFYSGNQHSTISAWRSWAKHDYTIIATGQHT